MSLFKSLANHFNKACGFLVLEFWPKPADRENNKKYDKVIVRNIASLLPPHHNTIILSLSQSVIAAEIQFQYVGNA